MLELKSIYKEYKMSDTKTIALNNVSLSFKANEFVSILGKSGSGKTTMLNIIGGLDRYTSGDLVINGRSTKEYKDRDWDAYRNQSIGFVFQSYNLIAHLSILANVELALTLSGIGKKERLERARKALVRVGLEDHIHKKPNQLSGGQMQRVSIARALVNDPEIILADEPTGALDSKTSVDIMNLLQSLSEEKLIIMVTHNDDLANEYSSRIVRLVDGEIVSDETKTPSKKVETATKEKHSKKTAMSFFTAFNLSLKNLLTKKARTIITAFAGSIGIIGIALVLLVSNGFNMYINNFQTNTLSGMPITISETTQTMIRPQLVQNKDESKSASSNITTYDKSKDTVHDNKLTTEYIDYVNKMDSSYLSGKTVEYGVQMPSLYQNGSSYSLIDKTTLNWSVIPNSTTYADQTFTVVTGKMPTQAHEVVLIVNDQKQLNKTVADALGLESTIQPDTLLNKTLKILPNDLYYQNINNQYVPLDESSYATAYASANAIEVKIVGVVQEKSTSTLPTAKDKTGIAYYSELSEELVTKNVDSQVAKAQLEAGDKKNVLTNRPFMVQAPQNQMPGPSTSSASATTTEKQYIQMLHQLGATKSPMSINLYPKDFSTKSKVTDYLNKYNDGKSDTDKVTYTDLAQTISNNMNTLVGAITTILVAFSGISLVVSSIMIGIITYVSVVERTKEIGILRSLGARKKDVSRVFNAETIIIGLSAGILGVTIAWLASFPATSILQSMLSDKTVSATLSIEQAAILIGVSMILTFTSGLIPARIATKQDPVKALRSE